MKEIKKEQLEVSIEIPVRFRDLDAMGHVNNAVYLTYLEMGRVAYFKALLNKDDISPIDFNFVLAKLEIDYLAPLKLNNTVICWIGIPEIGKRSFLFTYLLEEKESKIIVARATSVQVMYDYEKKKSIFIDDTFYKKVNNLKAKNKIDWPNNK